MDRHPQQIKRERQDIKKRARNVSNMSRLRTQIKTVLEWTDKEKAQVELIKLHPDFDDYLFDILKKDKKGILYLLKDTHKVYWISLKR